MLDKLVERYWTDEKSRGKLIQCCMLHMERSDSPESEKRFGKYRLKAYHMEDDEFRTKVYP